MRKLLAAAVAAAALCSGCAGGGARAISALPYVGPAIANADATSPPRTKVSFTVAAGAITIRSLSARIVLSSVNGKPPPAGIVRGVVVSLPRCNQGCMVSGPLSPPGTDAYAIAIFDARSANGNRIATGTATLKVVVGKVNTVVPVMARVPKTLAFGTIPAANAGHAFATARLLALIVRDADAVVIAGRYSVPVTVSDTDSAAITLASALSLNGGGLARSLQVAKSSDALRLAYGGLAIAPATLAARAPGASSARAVFAPTIVSIVYAGPLTSGAPEIDLYNPSPGNPGYSGTFRLAQAGWSGGGFTHGFTYKAGGSKNNCSSFALTPASGAGSTFKASVASGAVAGTCVLTLTGATSASTQIVVLTYTTNGIGVSQGKVPTL